MKNLIVAAILGGFLVAIPSLSKAVDRDIRIYQEKIKSSTCVQVQNEITKECYCVDDKGERTGETCVYIKGASIKRDTMKQ